MIYSDQYGKTRIRADIDVPVEEMGEWSPERIALFFGGIAKMVAAVAWAESERRVP